MKSMRRSDRKMDEKEALELLRRGEYGILCTCGSDNQPYGVPLSYVVIEDSIYFHCAEEGSKLDNITENSKVSFTVVGSTRLLPEKFSTAYESVIVMGNAFSVSEEKKYDPLMELIYKYSPDFLEEGRAYVERAKSKTKIVRIKIESITGKHRV